ncbi:hypothetical protein Gotur_017850, partial [Gossypium turneri]
VDLVPTVEEYTALLRCPRFQIDKAYSRAAYVPAFWKKLMNITGMSEQWIMARIKQKVEDNAIVRIWSEKAQLEKGDSLAKGYVSELWDYTRISVTQKSLQELKEIWDRIQQKGECKCIPWKNLRDLILAHPDGKKKVDVFALSIYGLVIFPRALGHVDEAGAVRYAPLLVLRQYSLRQFVPATHGLAQCEFLYLGDNYKKKVKEISQAWNQARRIKKLAVGSMTTPEYSEWRSKRINDNIPELNSEGVRPMEEYLQEDRAVGEEKMHLRLDADVQKLEAKKLRKGKNKAEEDLDSLKMDYKKLRLSIRIVGLGKTLDQW